MLVTVTGAKETSAAHFRAVLHPSTLARLASDTFSSFATRVTQLRELSMKADMLQRMMQGRESQFLSTMTANMIPETHVGIERMRCFSRTLDEHNLAIIPHAREKPHVRFEAVIFNVISRISRIAFNNISSKIFSYRKCRLTAFDERRLSTIGA